MQGHKEGKLIADDILEAFKFDAYRDEVTPSYRNDSGTHKVSERLTVNTPYGFKSDIHFYNRDRFFQRSVKVKWGTAKRFRGCTVLELEGRTYIVRKGKILKKL